MDAVLIANEGIDLRMNVWIRISLISSFFFF